MCVRHAGVMKSSAPRPAKPGEQLGVEGVGHPPSRACEIYMLGDSLGEPGAPRPAKPGEHEGTVSELGVEGEWCGATLWA